MFHMTNLVIWPRIERRLIYRRILRRIHGLTHWRIRSLVSWRVLRWIRTGVSVVLWGVVWVSRLGRGYGWWSIVIALRLGWIGWGIRWVSRILLNIGERHPPRRVVIIRFVWLKCFINLVKGSLATEAETTATAQSWDGNNSNDHTDNAAHWSAAARCILSLSLWFAQLPAEGVDVSAVGLLDVLLGCLVLVDGGQQAVGQGGVGRGGDGLILRFGGVTQIDLCRVLTLQWIQSLVDSLQHNCWRLGLVSYRGTIHIQVELTFSGPWKKC